MTKRPLSLLFYGHAIFNTSILTLGDYICVSSHAVGKQLITNEISLEIAKPNH